MGWLLTQVRLLKNGACAIDCHVVESANIVCQPQRLFVNPSVARIQQLFKDNDPTDYYWENFYRFLNGHSHKAVAALLNAPVWSSQEARQLLAMTDGVRVQEWIASSAELQLSLIFRANIKRNLSADKTPQDIATFRFNTVRACWDECSVHAKTRAWAQWGSGVKNVDSLGQAFMFECMASWRPTIPKERELKIQELVGTLDEFSSDRRNLSLESAGQIEAYSAMLHAEIQGLNGQWDGSTASVHTWRQLQGYPDFFNALTPPHPWMQSMCVAYTGKMVSNLENATLFRKDNWDYMQLQKTPWVPSDNALNPDDKLLAQALWRHFSGKDADPELSVQGLYFVLESVDSSTVISSLLNLGADQKPSTAAMDIDADVFSYEP